MKGLRAVLAALALSAAVPGAWAAAAPRSFYDGFPGAGRHWVDRLPAYSEHLVTDVGAFYLAFALLFAWAAARPARELVIPLAVAWSLFSTIHFAWHVGPPGRLPGRRRGRPDRLAGGRARGRGRRDRAQPASSASSRSFLTVFQLRAVALTPRPSPSARASLERWSPSGCQA